MSINEMILPDDTPIGEVPVSPVPQKPKREGPGFFRSIYEEAKEYNPEINALTTGAHKLQDLNSMFDEVPENWSSYNVDAIKNSHPDDWADILSAPTPKNQALMIQRRQEERANQEWLENGNWMGRLIGGAVGWTFSLANKIPVAGQVKSLSKASSFVKSAAQAIPGIAAQSAVVNASRLAAHDSMKLDDWFLDTARDTVFASLIHGGLGIRESVQIQNRLDGLKFAYDDIEWVAKVGKKGDFEGWQATAMNDSVGAARVSEAQKWVDNGLDKYGESPWFKKVFGASPVVKMMTNQFGAVREWGDLMFRPSNLLRFKASTQEGEQSAEQIMTGLMGGAYNSERIINNMWEEYAGINPQLPIKDTISHLKKMFGQSDFLTRQQFTEQVAYAFRRGDESTISQVSSAAKDIRKYYGKLYDEAVKLELIPEDLDPITAISYLNRIHNKLKMNVQGPEWRDAVVKDLMLQSQEINGLNAPMKALKSERVGVLEDLKKNPDNKDLKTRAKVLKERIKIEQKNLDDRVLSGDIDKLYVSSRLTYSKEELQLLESLRNPTIEAEKKLSKAKKSKNKESVAKAKEEFKNVKTKQQELLNDMRQAGSLNKRFYSITPKGTIKLKDPGAVPGLRRALTQKEAEQVAMKSYLKIVGQNEEQMLAQAFADGTADGGTNPLKARTLMVRDTAIESWLENDMAKLTQLYAGFMTRKIASEKVLRTLGTTSKDGIDGIINKLNAEFLAKKSQIELKPAGKEREKAIKDLTKDKDNAIELLNKSWKAFWGNYNNDKYSEGFRSFLAGLRDWTAATALGALPLMQMSDMAMIMKEFGIGPTLQESLFPMIKGIFKGKFKYAQEDLAHANLAINTALAAYSDGLFGHGTQYTNRGPISKFFGMAAQKFGNITGSNQLEDFFQHMAGTLSQSKTITTLRKFKSGQQLTKAEHERLHLLGLNKHQWTDKILAQADEFQSHSHYKKGDAYLLNIADWTDAEAAQIMLNSIKQEVDSIVLKTNIADVPFCFRDPVMQAMTMFMGYSFTSTNSRLINLMQRPDANKIMGEAIAMSMGAFVDPLREFLSGKEPDLSPKALMASALTNGAPGGIFIDGFNRMNAIFNIPYLNQIRNDRFRGKGAASLLLGAPGTMLDNMIRVIDSAANVAGGGGVSEGDVKRMIKMIPYTSAWEFRSGINNFVEAQNFPQRRRAAEGWLSD